VPVFTGLKGRLVRRTLIRRRLVRRLLLDGLLRLNLLRRLLLVGRVLRLFRDPSWSQILILICTRTLPLPWERILAGCRILTLTASKDRPGALLCLAVGLSLTVRLAGLRITSGWRCADAVGIEADTEELPFAVMLFLVPGAQRGFVAATCHARKPEALWSVARGK
jgi:hypothetical protein